MLITLMPIFWHECPYYAPLSSVIWSLYSIISYLAFLFLCCICCCYDTTVDRFDDLSTYYHDQIFKRMENLGEDTIREQESEIDSRVLKWTFETLIEDHELQRFFQYILGFRSSKVVKDPQQLLQKLGEWKLSSALVSFLHRTWLSNLVPESDKIQRLVVCVKVADAARLLDAIWEILDGVFTGEGRAILDSVETGHSLRNLGNTSDQETPLCAQSIVGCIIANVRNRDGRWLALARDQLCPAISKTDFDTYVRQGDNILLANLIHVTRQFHTIHDIILSGRMPSLNPDKPTRVISHFTRLLSNFDIRETLPALQHEFCALWNDLVEDAKRSGPDGIASHILIGFRHLYLDLHQDTNADLTAFCDPTVDENTLRRAVLHALCDHPNHLLEGNVTGLGVIAPIAIHDTVLTIPRPTPSPAHSTPYYGNESLTVGILGNRTFVSLQDEPVSRTPSIIHTSSIANSIPLATYAGGTTPQLNRETIMVPPMISGSSLPSPPDSGRTLSLDLHLHEDPIVNQSGIPHEPVTSLSSSITASSHTTPPVASVSGPNNTTISTILSDHRNIRDLNGSRLELTHQSGPTAPNIAMTALQPPNPR
ncbi:hypothetical protein BGW80DRAFT_827688 [Lactifluus volemus]|nr:hypothetical protein BGW80DRAFT_827688 [Lactifluus volemus]